MTSRRSTSYPFDTLLRDLDAADAVIDEGTRARAEAQLARILDDEKVRTPAQGALTAPAAGVVRPRRWARWLVPAAAAALVGGGLLVQDLRNPEPAYASWAATPAPLTDASLQELSTACRKAMDGWDKDSAIPADQRPVVRADTARVLLAERRGNFLFAAMRTDTGADVSCMASSRNPSQVAAMVGGAPVANAPAASPLAPSGLRANGVGLAAGPEGSVASTQGEVGTDVRGVTIHAEGRTVQATVANGAFAAWWPTTVRTPQEPMAEPEVTYDVTLADGRVLTNVDHPLKRRPPGPTEIGMVARGGGVGPNGPEGTVAGRAGDRVRTVTVHTQGRVVTAPVTDGAFRASWPQPPGGPVDDQPPVYDLTLDDGTVLRNVRPVS